MEEELIEAYCESWPVLAAAILQRLRVRGPGLDQPREGRITLSGLPAQESRVNIVPWICDDFLVVDLNHAIRRPAAHLAGSAFREQSNWYNQKLGGNLDISMQTQGGPRRSARQYAQQNNLASWTWRTAGDPIGRPICESCWVLYYCDYPTINVTNVQTLAPTEVGSIVIVTLLGMELGCQLKELDPAACVAMLREAGYPKIKTTGG